MRKFPATAFVFVIASQILSACSGKGSTDSSLDFLADEIDDELEERSSSSDESSSSKNDAGPKGLSSESNLSEVGGSSSSRLSSAWEQSDGASMVYGSTETAWPLLNPNIEYGELVDERDGKIYKTVQIGSQTWMAQNLAFDPGLKDKDGQPIDYCRQKSRCDTIGFEYPWSVSVDTMCMYGSATLHYRSRGKSCQYFHHHTRGICPEGWHMPSTDEFNILVDFVGGEDVAGAHLKANANWRVHANDPSNEFDTYGFAILPTDEYNDFAYIGGYEACFSRSALRVSSYGDETRFLDENIFKDMSVRCIKDAKKIPYSSEPVAACNENGVDRCEYGELFDVRDGKIYKTVVIGEQTWMAENLQYNSNYRDEVSGDSVETSWCHSRGACTSWYHTDEEGCALGRYYSWSGAMDSSGIASGIPSECGQDNSCLVKNRIQGVCPSGWHLPDSSEFNELVNYVHYVGKKYGSAEALRKRLYKSDVTGIYWHYDDNSVDAYGFGAIPLEYGYFDSLGNAKLECMANISNAVYEGYLAGYYAIFWSFWNSAETLPMLAKLEDDCYSMMVGTEGPRGVKKSLSKGIFSVRCVKD